LLSKLLWNMLGYWSLKIINTIGKKANNPSPKALRRSSHSFPKV